MQRLFEDCEQKEVHVYSLNVDHKPDNYDSVKTKSVRHWNF